jgi:hypothetical protein
VFQRNITFHVMVFIAVLGVGCSLRMAERRIQSTAARAPLITGSQPEPDSTRINETYGKLPLYFERNAGQTDSQVSFLARGSGYTLFLTRQAETVLVLRKPEPRQTPLPDIRLSSPNIEPERANSGPAAVVRIKLVGARPEAVEGLDELPGKANYFTGNDPKQWHANVPTYAELRYRNAYPGIDVLYYGNQRQVEHDFVVAPGGDPHAIRMRVEGADNLSTDADGNLVLTVNGGRVFLASPVMYQEGEGTRDHVAGRYKLSGRNEVEFTLGVYDSTRPLIIDPVLFYSTYLGGTDADGGVGIAVDASGNAYVTGNTASPDFPTTAFQTAKQPGFDAFVTKLNPAGTALVYSTYLGGDGSDTGLGIAVDAAGSAYVTGQTNSTNFPTTMGAFQTANQGGFDAFVTKLNPAGASLVYSTYLGGSGFDFGQEIALDATGNAYVTGETNSPNFPTTPGAFQTANAGSTDAFVTKLNPIPIAPLVYSTYLGGGSADIGRGIAVDAVGSAYITGFTSSTNFPTTVGSFQTTPGGFDDVFVTKLNPLGTALLYSTYLGGASTDRGLGIAVDAAGSAYVTGFTFSTNFPTTPGAFQTANAGAPDTFVTKLKPTGAALVYSTYLGGSSDDLGQGVAVDAAGSAYVTGHTVSTNYPTTVGAFQTANAGLFDAFVTRLNLVGNALVYSTYLGGDNVELGFGIAVDAMPNPNAYVTGYTYSTTPTPFPTTSGAYQTANAGSADAYVTKIADVSLGCTVPDEGEQGECNEVDGGGQNDDPGDNGNNNGAHGNFSLIARQSVRTKQVTGQLQYVSPANATRLQSVTLTSLLITGNTATLSGTCTNNGVPCVFTATMTDSGPLGTADRFTIAISDGLPRGGRIRNGKIHIRNRVPAG